MLMFLSSPGTLRRKKENNYIHISDVTPERGEHDVTGNGYVYEF